MQGEIAEKLGFNPRSREGSDMFSPNSEARCIKFQSTLPRRERLPLWPYSSGLSRVSIHAPAKGATSQTTMIQIFISVSIHAPAKGATNSFSQERREYWTFQSTLPRRERLGGANVLYHKSGVSIHAPAKGATHANHPCDNRYNCFNPRSREGSDEIKMHNLFWLICFNPRSREGSDHETCPALHVLSRFNPRSREGSDDKQIAKNIGVSVSIHAPAKGATLRELLQYQAHLCFNPRSREGSECISNSDTASLAGFNPRSREGSD